MHDTLNFPCMRRLNKLLLYFTYHLNFPETFSHYDTSQVKRHLGLLFEISNKEQKVMTFPHDVATPNRKKIGRT